MGEGHERLFSVYHVPNGLQKKSNGVLICPPLGREYLSTYKSLRILAVKLADAGFHVLRFDYSGYGDSSGETGETKTIRTYVQNINLCIDDFKKACGLENIYLVGVRFSALLAMIYATLNNVEGLALWAPVLNGNDYINELAGLQRKFSVKSFAKFKNVSPVAKEFLGFLFSKDIIKEIKTTHYKNYCSFQNLKVLLFINPGYPVYNSMVSALSVHNEVEIKNMENVDFWLKKEDDSESKAMIPYADIITIVNWFNNG